jgi:[citrate (pro-3S)-lyase] ligase
MLTTKRLWLDRDQPMRERWLEFLKQNNLQPEEVDYTVGIFDDGRLIGTGSIYQNIIKLIAVCGDYQEQNLLTLLVTELADHLWANDITHYFLYTKPENLKYFTSLGFKRIIETDTVAFMERGTPDLKNYLSKLAEVKTETQKAGAIVMNANPFTKGHLYLVETALKQCDHLYVFVLSDESSLFSFEERFRLVKEGVAHLPGVTVVPSREYQVSQATFPAYFLKDQAAEEVAKSQAELDATLFKEKIAPVLDIRIRFMGEEPLSKVTEIYNEAMAATFGEDMELVVVPRLQSEGEVISATRVRQAIKDKNIALIKHFVPETTYRYLTERFTH